MWILIVMMFGGNGSGVAYVPGFTSRATCETAKIIVEQQATPYAGFPKAVCVTTN